jgi:hypothetical protein
VYPCQTMLDDVQIDTSSYVIVKVDMVHNNLKDLKLKVPSNDTTLTMRDAVTRMVQWRWISVDVDPSTTALASTTPSQPNTSLASIVPEACLSPSPNPELSPIQEQVHSSLIQDQPHLSPIQEKPHLSPILELP